MNYHYSSALRINPDNLSDLTEKLKKYDGSFDRILFFSNFTHSARELAFHRTTAKKIQPYMEEVKKLGIEAGVNVMTTVGFFEEGLDASLSGLTPYCSIKDRVVRGRICASDRDNLEYIREVYRIYASIAPSVIYSDDDISSYACACDRCLKRFSALYPDVLSESAVTRKALRDAFGDPDWQKRKRAREAWIGFNALRIGEIYETIEKAVHEVDPTIVLGGMSSQASIDGIDTDAWTKKLSGEVQKEICWRPGGGVYSDASYAELIGKAVNIAAQVRFLPHYGTKVESEIENFPYQSLMKSPAYTAFEAFIYQAAGCTGTTYNVLSKEEAIGEEHESFFKMAKEAYPYGKLLTKTFQREPLCGIGFWWNKQSAMRLSNDNWCGGYQSVPAAVDFHQIGIPYACDPRHMSVFLLNRSIALQIPNDELMQILSKGVLMDAEALTVLNERGFGNYTGFQTVSVHTENTLEQELEHDLNMTGNHRRNIRQAFPWVEKEAFVIEKTNEKAEYLSEHRDLSGDLRGMGAGVFENCLGGRVCVEGITPFHWCFSLPRSTHVKKVIRWLSKDTVPAYVASFHRMSVWCRGNAVMLANISTEDAENAEVLLRTDAKTASVTVTKGSRITKEQKIPVISGDGEYKKIVIPCIPITGTALVVPEA